MPSESGGASESEKRDHSYHSLDQDTQNNAFMLFFKEEKNYLPDQEVVWSSLVSISDFMPQDRLQLGESSLQLAALAMAQEEPNTF